MIRALVFVAKATTTGAFSALIAGCNLLPVRTVHDYCQLDRPVKLTRAEFLSLSDESAKQIMAHNNSGQDICKWRRK